MDYYFGYESRPNQKTSKKLFEIFLKIEIAAEAYLCSWQRFMMKLFYENTYRLNPNNYPC